MNVKMQCYEIHTKWTQKTHVLYDKSLPTTSMEGNPKLLTTENLETSKNYRIDAVKTYANFTFIWKW